jgi:hypothetical protein
MVTNYATLQTAIAEYLNRQDLTDQIPMFIQFVESDMSSRLRCREMIKRSTATSSAEYVGLPVDWLEGINLKIVGGKSPLRYVTLDEADRLKKANTYTNVGAYSLMDGAIELIPDPADNVEIEMVYYGKIPALATSSTNWLLAKSPDVYLYGALTHAAPFLLDDQRIPVVASIYLQRIEALNVESERSLHSGSPLISKSRTIY